jgi:hypothetical protein
MKAARRHILVGVQENNETFPRMSPCKELLLEFPQKDDAWAVCNALLAEMAAVLLVDRFLPFTAARDIDGNDAGGMPIPALEKGPGPSAQIPIINAGRIHPRSHLSQSELKGSPKLP